MEEHKALQIHVEDVMILPSLAEEVHKLSDEELISLYKRVTDVKIYSWGFNCLLSYEAHHNRGISFQEIAKAFGTTRQTCWREAAIWDKIISKAPGLLDDPFLSKSWFKRVIENEAKDPIKALKRIAQLREKLWYKNVERVERGLPKIKYSIRTYISEVKQGRFVCDLCKERMDYYKKVCDMCFDKIKEMNKND